MLLIYLKVIFCNPSLKYENNVFGLLLIFGVSVTACHSSMVVNLVQQSLKKVLNFLFLNV